MGTSLYAVRRLFKVMILDAESDKSGEILISGYSSGSDWYYYTVHKSSENLPDVRLVYGTLNNVTAYYVAIGTPSTTWKYLYVSVVSALLGETVVSTERTGWEISLTSTEPDWIATKTPNVTIGVPQPASTDTDKYLKYTSSGLTWATVSGGTGASSLAGLDDVTITSAAKGNLLWHNGSGWANVAGPSTSGYVLAETVSSGAVTALTWVNPNLVGVATRATNNSTKNYLIGIQTYSSAGNRSAYVSYGGYQYFQGNGVFCTKSLVVSDYSTTLGVVYNNTLGIVTTLTGGTAGQVLRVDSDGTGLEWATISSGSTTLSGLTDTSISSPGAYALLYYDSTSSKWTNLAAPTDGKYLKYVTGTGLTWASVSGGGGLIYV